MKVVTNKKAYFDYFVVETFQAGIVLIGSEVKSIRAGNVNLKDSFVTITPDNEAFVRNMHIAKYDKANDLNDEKRSRKLLLNSQEIRKLKQKVCEKGLTIVPLKIYFKEQFVKLEIALVKGKHNYDKRDVLKEKDQNIEAQRELKNY